MEAGTVAVSGSAAPRRPKSVPEELWAAVPEGERARVTARGAALVRRGLAPTEALSVAMGELGIEPVGEPAPPPRPRGLPLRAKPTGRPPSQPSPPAPAPPVPRPAAGAPPAPGGPRAASASRPRGLSSRPRPPAVPAAPVPGPPASPLARAIHGALGIGGPPGPDAAEIEALLLAEVSRDPGSAAADPRCVPVGGRRMPPGMADAVADLLLEEAERVIGSIRALRAAGDPGAAAWLDPDDSSTWDSGTPLWR